MDYPTQYGHNDGLGWIVTAITAVATLVPMVLNRFKKPPMDVWSGWSRQQKTAYINQSIVAGKEAKRNGSAPSVEYTVSECIAQVELDENWETWKKKNEWAVPMIAQAEIESNQMLQTASIIDPNMLLIGVVLGLFGFAYFKRDLIRAKFFNKQIAA